MHFHAEIWIPNVADVAEQIKKAMAPHEEEYSEDTDSFSGFWDWYQIGGRWTGVHNPDYEPEQDPQNIEKCDLCHGTGFRADEVGASARAKQPEYTCNGCGTFDEETRKWTHGPHGPGRRVKWPTQWASCKFDLMPVSDIRNDLTAYTLLVNGDVFHQEQWDGEKLNKTDYDGKVAPKLADLGITNGYLVTVDYHS